MRKIHKQKQFNSFNNLEKMNDDTSEILGSSISQSPGLKKGIVLKPKSKRTLDDFNSL